MLPSPSLGPPLLSASRSPAVGPCGMLDELDELDAEDAGAEDDEAGAELVDEDDEPPPQPAAAKAAITSPPPASRRSKLILVLMSSLRRSDHVWAAGRPSLEKTLSGREPFTRRQSYGRERQPSENGWTGICG